MVTVGTSAAQIKIEHDLYFGKFSAFSTFSGCLFDFNKNPFEPSMDRMTKRMFFSMEKINDDAKIFFFD